MPETINRNQYDCRTMSYYSNLGGIFEDLINVLEERYAESKDQGMPEPIKLLNSASYWKDKIELNEEGKKDLEWLPVEGDKLMLCVLGCISLNNIDIQNSLKKNWVTDVVYYPMFKPIMDKWADMNEVSFYMTQNEKLTNQIKELNEQVAMQRGVIDYNLQTINYLLSNKNEFPGDLGYLRNGSFLDDVLTFDSIMEWVERHPFQNTLSVIDMIEERMMMVKTTDEQRTRLIKAKDTLTKMKETAANSSVIIVNEADGTTNIYSGETKKNTSQAAAGNDNKEGRLKKALNAIEKKLEKFDDKMLWHDNEGRKMNTSDLVGVFNKCFGIGYHPGTESGHAQMAEKLCSMLIEKRKGCGEVNENGYVTHTVLNILGYFKANGLINGSDKEIAAVIIPIDRQHYTSDSYEEYIAKMSKNVNRGRNGVFEGNLAEYLSYHIDELKKNLKLRTPSKNG